MRNGKEKKDSKHVWPVNLLIAIGFAALIYYFGWWFTPSRLATPWLVGIMLVGIICATPQLVGNWLLYLKVPPPRPLPPLSDHFTVDVFITAYDEDLNLVQKALSAARAMRGEFKLWLLDDSSEPAHEELAAQYGAGYLTRSDRRNAKAGNINAALQKTNGDVIVIFDIDHLPNPGFLERTVPHFHTGDNGFIQVMLTFYNGEQSWIARAARESSLDYYNPTCRGSDGLNGATLTGSNALIRRRALEDIGGYRPGLAEDLATSIALHAIKWRSVYVPEPLAPGLAPHDLRSWFTQQFKWSRGVFELLLTAYPRLFFKLTKGQKLIYAIRMTYYWIGPVIMAHILITVLTLFSGNDFWYRELNSYFIHLIPLALIAVIIRQAAIITYILSDSSAQSSLWRGTALIFGTWPIYTTAWFMAIFRLPLKFRSTPKNSQGSVSYWWLAPQIVTTLALLGGIIFALITNHVHSILPVSFAFLLAVAQLPIIYVGAVLERLQPSAQNVAPRDQSWSI